MQISQQAGQVVWYTHLLKNFPVCCDPHSQIKTTIRYHHTPVSMIIIKIYKITNIEENMEKSKENCMGNFKVHFTVLSSEC